MTLHGKNKLKRLPLLLTFLRSRSRHSHQWEPVEYSWLAVGFAFSLNGSLSLKEKGLGNSIRYTNEGPQCCTCIYTARLKFEPNSRDNVLAYTVSIDSGVCDKHSYLNEISFP